MAASEPPYLRARLNTIVLVDGDKRAGQLVRRGPEPARHPATTIARLDGREEIAERDESGLKPAES